MLIKRRDDIQSSEITPEEIYVNRREFIKKGIGTGLAVGTLGFAGVATALTAEPQKKWQSKKRSPFDTDEELTSYKDITTYNNFYEFGIDKSDPAANSGSFKPLPWEVEIAGEAIKTGVFNLEDILKPHTPEDRIYRLRCVEGWSMVIPWLGIPLADILKRFEPTSKAKFVHFTTVLRPGEMPGQNRSYFQWPYVEGLRMDEAMNPLPLLATGLYGKSLLNQSGAPLRLVVPWKYGFKSIKSIVKINFVASRPRTTWEISDPREYGFYSNVNPEVDHPRWSQGRERRIGDFYKRKTLMFNGYGDQVASMYSGMDLRKNF